MADERETTQQPVQGKRPGAWLRLVVEGFSLLGALAFLAAVGLTQALFSRWGLSFLQVASASDVIMAGLGAVLNLSGLLVAATIGAVTGLLSRRARLLWWGLLVLESAAVVVLTIAMVVSLEASANDAVRFFLVLVLAPLGHLLTHRRAGVLMRRRSLAVAVALVLGASALSVINFEVGRHALLGDETHLLQPVLPGCHGLVLWQGERAMVVQCDYGRPPEDVRILYNAENIIVTTAPVVHAAAPQATP